MKHVDFPYFSTLETIGFPFVFTRSYQILQKKTGFFSLVVKGILRYKKNLCFFFKIIYFMKSQAKLVDSNMEFHGFFELRRDTTVAWSVFRFLNSS